MIFPFPLPTSAIALPSPRPLGRSDGLPAACQTSRRAPPRSRAHERPRRLHAAGPDGHLRVRDQRRRGGPPAAPRPVRRGLRHLHRRLRRRHRARRLHRRRAAGRPLELELPGGVAGRRGADHRRLPEGPAAALSGAAVRCDRARHVLRGRRAEGAGLQRERRGRDPAGHVQRGGRRRDPRRAAVARAGHPAARDLRAGRPVRRDRRGRLAAHQLAADARALARDRLLRGDPAVLAVLRLAAAGVRLAADRTAAEGRPRRRARPARLSRRGRNAPAPPPRRSRSARRHGAPRNACAS